MPREALTITSRYPFNFKADWSSDKRPESDGNQQYFTSLPVILHDMIEENIKVIFGDKTIRGVHANTNL